MTVKRSIRDKSDDEEVEKLAMANCALMLLSRVDDKSSLLHRSRAFKCKTCDRQFESFQALGGHRASHKKLKSMEGTYRLLNKAHLHKKHDCSICGLEFGTGQALGGHMRRHRGAALIGEQGGLEDNSVSNSAELVPVLKKSSSSSSSSSKRVCCWDLNLMPYENGLDLGR